MADTDFVHLHVHTHYSLLDGLNQIAPLVSRAKELGMKALAITDHGAMHGVIEFYQECRKQDLKPIIGQECYVAPRRLTDKASGLDTKPYHLLLLAKNLQGYRNLIKLTTIAHLEGYYYKPRIDRDLLSRHAEGLIASTACLASETSRLILSKNWPDLEQTINEYREIFGQDHYYLELQHHPSIPEQQVVNQHLLRVAEEMKLPLIVTNDVHYLHPEDHDPHDKLVCIQTGKLVSDSNRMIYAGDFSLKPVEELAAAFPDRLEALASTGKIAAMTNLEIPLGANLLPEYPLPTGETAESWLRKLSQSALLGRFPTVDRELQARLEYELKTISKTGFAGYMLIVADMIQFARQEGILVGPGRGSAAGSLIAYVLGITNVDPIRYGLLFERFLDLNRVTMPDIDTDFEDERRHEVINYLKDKYGADHVAGIITFGTIMARAAVRDVGRVLGMSYNEVDRIAKLVPTPVQGRHIPLKESIQSSPDLKQVYEGEPAAKELIDSAIKLEGTIRHASQHACAIVISKEPLDQYVPVQASQGGDIHQITQYAMHPIESIGLLKMDLLGLTNLTTLRRAQEIIRETYQTTVDLDNLPLDDKKTYGLLGRGETVSVFQLESDGMRRYIKELKPSRLEDIIAMVSLYRPGPIQWIESFINRKRGREPVSYLHPLAKAAFEETYGIPVYQEQVMRMTKDMCGFNDSEADTLRKAIGKKIPKLMKEIRSKFVAGAVKNGVELERAELIFGQLEDFAAYCFNKSHATGYALIAYQTAYLKAHFPDCFMAAAMTSSLNDIERISIEITECERLGLKVLPPDVNQSLADFAVVKDERAIRFGLAAIKNVGGQVARSIVSERQANGPYPDLENFLGRNGPALNKKVLDSLIRSGALDRFNDRGRLFAGLELIAKFSTGTARQAPGQMSIFAPGGSTPEESVNRLALPLSSSTVKDYLAWERELLGLYLTDHPLKLLTAELKDKTTPLAELDSWPPGRSVRVAGSVVSVKKITTKSGQPMAFVNLEDLSGALEAIVFPGPFETNKLIIQPNSLLLVEGKTNDKDGTIKILVDRIWPLEAATLKALSALPIGGRGKNPAGSKLPATNEVTEPQSRPVQIDLPANASKQTILALKTLLDNTPGNSPVHLRLNNRVSTQELFTGLRVSPSDELLSRVAQLLNGPVASKDEL